MSQVWSREWGGVGGIDIRCELICDIYPARDSCFSLSVCAIRTQSDTVVKLSLIREELGGAGRLTLFTLYTPIQLAVALDSE